MGTEGNPRILVVDDERDNIEALKRLLRKDFEILSANSGEEAFDILGKSPFFDVILSDQRMPGMTGSELLGRAQGIDALATRVLLTGFSDLEAVIDAVNQGHIWRYISKPWEPEDLKLVLKQAAERSRLSRSLDESRRDLERALTELRAKDWARERLLQILLHEFRTAPQILEGLRGLDPNDADSPARERFIASLVNRFAIIERDITSLMAEEKRSSALPKEMVSVSQIFRGLDPKSPPEMSFTAAEEPKVFAHRASLEEALRHLKSLLVHNSLKAPVAISMDLSRGPKADLFVAMLVEGQPGQVPLPAELSTQTLEPRLAWSLLLEPFVGAGNFAHHSTGLRVESARVVRLLGAMGGRAEFQVDPKKGRVELLLVFKSLERAP